MEPIRRKQKEWKESEGSRRRGEEGIRRKQKERRGRGQKEAEGEERKGSEGGGRGLEQMSTEDTFWP